MNSMLVLVICFSFFHILSDVPSSFEQIITQKFPGCSFVKENLFLDKEQVMKAKKLSKVSGQNALGLRFLVDCKEKNKRTVYFDSHIVRTLNETVMISVKEDGDKSMLESSEILFFQEPPEYKPNKLWMKQFENKELSKKLKVYSDIDGLTGSTLSAKAVTHSARRILALHKTLK